MSMSSDALSRLQAALISPWEAAGLDPDAPVLLGLSGGADSRLLLHLMAKACQKNGAVLHVAHLHHGIRGSEADRDEVFCRKLAENYGAVYHTARIDAPKLAKERGQSLETAARDARYAFFANVMREFHLSLLLTAHHADDNAETVLLRLCRGSGLAGLGGIAPVRPFEQVAGATIVRPLLHCRRADVLAACEQLSLDYVTDSTNTDLTYARNWLRAKVLPVLRELTDHPEEQISRAAATLREDEEFLSSQANALLENHADSDRFDREALKAAHPSIAKRAIRLWIVRASGYTPEYCHTEQILSMCQERISSRAVDLPGDVTVTVEKSALRLSKKEIAHSSVIPALCEPVAMGEQVLSSLGWRVTLQREDASDPSENGHKKNTQNGKNVYNPFIRDTLTFDTIMECDLHGLYWRLRQSGDTLLLRGVNRKLRKLQNEVGLPPDLRDRLPLLCCGDTVLWAPFVGVRDGAFSCNNKDSNTTLHLTIESIFKNIDFSKEDLPYDQSHS